MTVLKLEGQRGLYNLKVSKKNITITIQTAPNLGNNLQNPKYGTSLARAKNEKKFILQ